MQVININTSLDYNDKEIKDAIFKKYKVKVDDFKIIQRSLDARRSELKFNLKVAVDVKKPLKDSSKLHEPYRIPQTKCDLNIAIVGAGPAGLYAAHILSKCGANIDVYERGGDVDQRVKDVDAFISTRKLNPNSNISFGEGGAGTFSDGKLTSRSKDSRKEYIKEVLFKYGADEEITIMHKPHIGTDVLREVIKKFRNDLIDDGVKFHFNTKVDSLIIENKICKGVVVNDDTKRYDKVILALGNAARDTFKELINLGVDLSAKPFAIGFRIEHLQSYVDQAQFREYAGHPRLLRGEYNLATEGVYSFCMCPGGEVVPSSSEPGYLSVNGMSYHNRGLTNANSAIVTTVNRYENALEAIKFQEEIEKRAFILGGLDYTAPAIHVQDFLENRLPKTFMNVKPSYRLGVKYTKIDEIYTEEIANKLREGLLLMNNKMHDFTYDAMLTAVESKTSSPVRINRDENFTTNIEGLYACGEGAGYAGGIVSAGLDGLKCAEKILEVLWKSLRLNQNILNIQKF